MKSFSIAISLLLLINCAGKKFQFKIADLNAPSTTSSERQKFQKILNENTILKNLSLELNAENESKWQAAFWGMELSLYRSDSAFHSLKRAFQTFKQRSPTFQRALLEVVFCLYPDEFLQEISQFTQATSSPKLFAMAIHYLKRNQPGQNNKFQKLIEKRFPDWQKNPILFMLHKDMQFNQQPMPPLIEMLKHPFGTEKTIIYSFQRNDRDYPGLTIIKQPDGKFVRNRDGSVFQIPHLARAISKLPGYITNGNTPQGIFSIQGIDVSTNVFIGQTPNLQLVMSFEVSVQNFFHSKKSNDTTWTEDQYRQLMPESWHSYSPIYETFYAGKAGRTEIIAHGTTIDPEFYAGQPYYPNTPSLGCLTAKELWSGKDGRCLISDQLSFINAFRSAGSKEGYLVVIELDDKKQPVVLGEVIMDLLKAEGE